MANATRPSATFPTIDNALRAPTFRRSRLRHALGLVAAAALAGESGLAFTAELEEVIVTAQKREENTMDVPAAVSVLSASALERLGVANFNDVARISPSITIEQGANSNNNTIRMRGVGTYSYSIGIEPSVSVVIDDVAVVRQAQAFANLSDIDRIEVLRGPQGTLFGKNASAGVVNIVTKAPGDTLGGSVEVSATDRDEKKVNASLTGPLGESVGFRLNAFYLDRGGYIDNIAGGPDLNSEESRGFRGKLVWNATDALDITLIADYLKQEIDGPAGTHIRINPTATLFGLPQYPLSTVFARIHPGEGNTKVMLDDSPFNDSETRSGILKLNYQIGEHTLTSITSHQKWEYDFQEDLDGTNIDVMTVFTGGRVHGGLIHGGPFKSTQFTEDLRLTSPSSTTFEYLLGLFYADSRTDRTFVRGPVIYRADWNASAGSESLAAFAQATYHLTDTTRLSGGMRFNREKIDVRFRDKLAAGGTGATYRGDETQDAVTGKLALQHDLSDEVMVFGSASTGYKGQGYDITSGFNQASADHPVGEETSTSWELGVKGMFFERRLRVETVAFLSDYDDFQAQSAVTEGFLTTLKLNNVGKLRTKGIETDLSLQATDSLRIDANIAYVDAEIRKFPHATCYPGQTAALGCNVRVGTLTVQDLAGKKLANSPDWKFSIGATYEHEVPGMPFDMFAHVDYQWQDDVVFDLFQDPLTEQDAYGVANLNFGIVERDNERYRVTAFVNNLGDENYASMLINGGNSTVTKQWTYNAQRYAGLRVKFTF